MTSFYSRVLQERPLVSWVILTISRLVGIAVAYAVLHLIWPTAAHPKDVLTVILSISAIDFWRIAFPGFEKESLWKRIAVGAVIGLSIGLIFNFAGYGYSFFLSLLG